MNEKAFSADASMAARVASISSTGERSPERNASTSEQVSLSHGVVVIGAVNHNRCRHGDVG